MGSCYKCIQYFIYLVEWGPSFRVLLDSCKAERDLSRGTDFEHLSWLLLLLLLQLTCSRVQLLKCATVLLQHFDAPEMVRHFHIFHNVSFPQLLDRFGSLRRRGLRLHYWP